MRAACLDFAVCSLFLLCVMQDRATAQSVPDPGPGVCVANCGGTSTYSHSPTVRKHTPPDRPFPMSVRAAVESAAKSPSCIGPNSCNFFVGSVGNSLDIPYFRDILVTSHPDHYVANKIYDFISKAVKSRGSGWIAVYPFMAQALADRGDFVIGVARNVDPSHMGHIVIVVPSSWGPRGEPGSGPWVRDGESPNVSRRAGWRFGSDDVEPIYAFWNNYMKSCMPDYICE